MTELAEKTDPFVQRFPKLERELPGNHLDWLREIRKSAIDRFAELGFPKETDEEWKHTRVDPIADTVFKPAPASRRDGLKLQDIEALATVVSSSIRLVFVNGRYAPDLSTLRRPASVRVESLAAALNTDGHDLEPHLAKHTDIQNHAFAALNTAFFNDGAFVHFPRGTTLEEPILLLFVSISDTEPIVSYPRVLIVAEQDTKAAIVESYAGLGNEVYFTNAVTEVWLGENAILDYYKLQQENLKAFHIATLKTCQDRHSTLTSHSISLGGALVRNDVSAVLDAEGAECTLNGFYMAAGQQHVDNHTTIDHAKPHGSSRELYKGILNEQSRAVFNGAIIVRPNAQKTDALQVNKNLLLSKDSLVHTKPELKIFANDVKCKHGATIGQVAPEALFYLRSRGIDAATARRLLIYAFAGEMVDRVRLEPLRAWLAHKVSSNV